MASRGEVYGGAQTGSISTPEAESSLALTLRFENKQFEHGLSQLVLASESSFVSMDAHRLALIDILLRSENAHLTPAELVVAGFTDQLTTVHIAQSAQWINDAFIEECKVIELNTGDNGWPIESVQLAEHVRFTNYPDLGDPKPQPIAAAALPAVETAELPSATEIGVESPDLNEGQLAQVKQAVKELRAETVAAEEIIIAQDATATDVLHSIGKHVELSDRQRIMLSLLVNEAPNGNADMVIDRDGHTLAQLFEIKRTHPDLGLDYILKLSPADITSSLNGAIASIAKVSPPAAEIISQAIESPAATPQLLTND